MTIKIPITFLGTSQAVPTAKRNHTSILLEYNGENILIDCGEGTQRQFRKAKLNPCRLTKLLITHWHGDHILGIPGLLQTLALNNYSRTLEVYLPKGTKHYMDLMYRLFVFKEKIKMNIHEVDSGKILETKEFIIISEKMDHDTPCNAYSFIIKEKLRIKKDKLKKLKLKGPIISQLAQGKDIVVNGKKIKSKDMTYLQEGKKITFILDTKINSNCYKIAENSDLLISEAVYMKQDAELSSERKHLTAEQAAEIAKKSKSQKLVLTHLSQRYDGREKFLLAEAKKKFKNTILAEDLLRIEV